MNVFFSCFVETHSTTFFKFVETFVENIILWVLLSMFRGDFRECLFPISWRLTEQTFFLIRGDFRGENNFVGTVIDVS